MANDTDDSILEAFQQIWQGWTEGSDGVAMPGWDLNPAVPADPASSASMTQKVAGTNAAAAVLGPSAAGSTEQSASSGGGSVLASAGNFFKNESPIGALVSGLMGLFGGGDDPPPALVKYALPPKLSFDLAESGGMAGTARATQNGFTQMLTADAGTASVAQTSAPTSGSSRGTGQSPAPVVSIQVQAMDSQSFMDRSHDIARAVREAMLNMNSINDVVNDL